LPDALVGKLAELGFTDDLVHAYNALMGAIQGFVLVELATVAATDQSSEDVRVELSSLDPQRFPNIASHFDQLADRAVSIRWSDASVARLDDSFDYLLEMLIDALTSRMRPVSRRGGR
jgi:hypothetical protein